MSSTTFTSGTVIASTWLNDVNTKTYNDNSSTVAYTPSGTGAVTTTVQAKLQQTVSVKDFGAVCDGTTDDSAALANASAAAVAAKVSLVIPGTMYIGTSTQINAFIADTFGQLFTLTSKVVMNSGQPIRPEWWGANKTTDSAPAINAAILSLPFQHYPDTTSAKTVLFSQFYHVESPIIIPSLMCGLTLEGNGNQGSGLNVAHNGNGIVGDTSSNNTTLRNFRISTLTPTASTGNGIVFTAYDSGTFLGWFICEQMWVQGFRAGTAFVGTQLVYSFFNNNYFGDCYNGMHVSGLSYVGKVQNQQFECSNIGFLTDGSSTIRSWSFDTINPQGFYRLPEATTIRMQYGFYFNQNSADISIKNCWFEGVLQAGIQTDVSKNYSNFLIEEVRFSDNLCNYGFLLNNMTTAVLQNNNFSNITAEVYLYNCANVLDTNSIHVNATQSKWFVDNGPAGDYNIFQPSQSTTTRSNDTVYYVPTYNYPAGFKLLTAGGGGSGGLSAYAQFGDGSGYVLKWRNNASTPTALYNMYDTGDFQILPPNKGIILTTPDGTHTYRITINNSGGLVTTLVT